MTAKWISDSLENNDSIRVHDHPTRRDAIVTAPRNFFGRVSYVIATGFGVGRVPYAPGTAGTLLAVPLYLLLRELPVAWYLAVAAALFLIGVVVCDQVERQGGEHDAPTIVWDEIVGYLVTMTLAPPGWAWVVAGFVLFRLFDIWKPYPIRRIDRTMLGGFGTMLDDLVAAIYGVVVLQLLAYALARVAG